MVYLQQGLSKDAVRAPFDFKIVNGLLESDNTLYNKEAVFLNTTGLSIHSEATYVIVYQFEK